MNPTLATTLSAVSVGLVGVCAAGLCFIARKVVGHRPHKLVDVEIDLSRGEVSLPLKDDVLRPGDHGLWLPDSAHIRVGSPARSSGDVVTRPIVRTTGSVDAGRATGRWSGHAIAHPSLITADAFEVCIETPHGQSPAWVLPSGTGDGKVWAVHVHGLNTSRHSVLRSVPATHDLGLVSLVPSYFGDEENSGGGKNFSHLGQIEWEDVEAALDWAVTQGAERFVLFGWSLGAQISLQLTEHSKHRSLIEGLILVSPATDMKASLHAVLEDAGLPRFVAKMVPYAMSTWPMYKFSGLTESLDFSALDWAKAGRLTKPSLVIHSDGDTDVPASITRRFVEANHDNVDFVLWEAVPHQLEWNTEPVRFEATVTAWLSEKGLVAAPRA